MYPEEKNAGFDPMEVSIPAPYPLNSAGQGGSNDPDSSNDPIQMDGPIETDGSKEDAPCMKS